jgi:hypothetical protein
LGDRGHKTIVPPPARHRVQSLQYEIGFDSFGFSGAERLGL